jgi:predicted negative regulator of RcsB-dependent stress response
MALDLEEQEQIDELKAWWNKNGKSIISLLIVAMIAYIGWNGYQYWMNKKATEASNLYQTLITSDSKNNSDIKTQTAKLIADFSNTPYAGRAAVYGAKVSYTAKDNKEAISQLQWAISNAKETSVQAIAALELAGVYYDVKDYDNATKVLNAINDQGYVGLKDNLLGDVLLAQGKTAEAKGSFESALKNLDQQGKFYQLTKQKLESLGA